MLQTVAAFRQKVCSFLLRKNQLFVRLYMVIAMLLQGNSYAFTRYSLTISLQKPSFYIEKCRFLWFSSLPQVEKRSISGFRFSRMKIFGEVSEYEICMVCNPALQLNIVSLQKNRRRAYSLRVLIHPTSNTTYEYI